MRWMILAWCLAACQPKPTPDDSAIADPDCDFTSIDIYVMYEHVVDGVASDCEVARFEEILIDREKGAGPWYEDLFVVFVDDTQTLDTAAAVPIHTQAAVPEIFLGPDGRYYLYYVEGDLEWAREVARTGSDWFATHGIVGYGALRLMVSDDGLSFTEEDAFEVEGIVRGLVVDPDVRALPDGTYRLYYVGTPIPDLLPDGSWDDGAEHIVYYAESTDLIHWIQVGIEPFLLSHMSEPRTECRSRASSPEPSIVFSGPVRPLFELEAVALIGLMGEPYVSTVKLQVSPL